MITHSLCYLVLPEPLFYICDAINCSQASHHTAVSMSRWSDQRAKFSWSASTSTSV